MEGQAQSFNTGGLLAQTGSDPPVLLMKGAGYIEDGCYLGASPSFCQNSVAGIPLMARSD